jgi:NADH:ubiquinone reductase (non-electrogenic)
VYIRTDTIVAEVREDRVVLQDGEEIRCGMVIWSTGVGPRDVVRDLDVSKTPNGRILVDKHLR